MTLVPMIDLDIYFELMKKGVNPCEISYLITDAVLRHNSFYQNKNFYNWNNEAKTIDNFMDVLDEQTADLRGVKITLEQFLGSKNVSYSEAINFHEFLKMNTNWLPNSSHPKHKFEEMYQKFKEMR